MNHEILPGEHVILFGLPGSGKTTLTRKISAMYERKIVFDRLGEWEGFPTFRDFDSFAAAYRDELSRGDSFTLVIRPPAGYSQERLIEFSDQVLALVYQCENFNREGLAIIFEEIWLYVPLHGVSDWMYEILLTGRHPRISLIGNAQRPALVSKTLVSMSKHVFIGNFFEANDRKYYRDLLGDHPIIENPPPKHRFLWLRPTHAPLSEAITVES